MRKRDGITALRIAAVLLTVCVGATVPAAAGTLKVTSFPSGAQVLVDGANTGKVTPMNIALADGEHTVTVQIPGSGWNPDTRTVTIVAGNNDLSVTLLPSFADVQAQMGALQALVTTLQGQVAALQSGLTVETTARVNGDAQEAADRAAGDAALQSQINTIGSNNVPQNLLDLANYVSVDPNTINDLAGPHVIFTGANVHIRNGLGATNGNVVNPASFFPNDIVTNGVGNLIVGYNEKFISAFPRDGSHNVVIGREHGYASIGGFVAGLKNQVLNQFASVSGGQANTASGLTASVSGGGANSASGDAASVSGGTINTASGSRASVSGGTVNIASSVAASVSGGALNIASGGDASVSGGRSNTASGGGASVSGGTGNTASGNRATVSGGQNLIADDDFEHVP